LTSTHKPIRDQFGNYLYFKDKSVSCEVFYCDRLIHSLKLPHSLHWASELSPGYIVK